MKIEIETTAEYVACARAMKWAIEHKAEGCTPEGTDMVWRELALALDDYRQIHYPLGGDPK